MEQLLMHCVCVGAVWDSGTRGNVLLPSPIDWRGVLPLRKLPRFCPISVSRVLLLMRDVL